MTVLPFPAGLSDKFTFYILHRFTQGFTVGDLRTTNVRLNAKFTLHAVNDDLQMQLAHPGDDGLSGLFVRVQAKRRILRSQAL
ncbi:Uncharacterised protein [Enterobacter cloacae]|nr:Uncharacterised protein [Enterobacter cloacae]